MHPGPFLAALILSSFFPVGAHAFSASHDGRWQVELETTVGACEKSGVAILTVKGGQLAAIDASGVFSFLTVSQSLALFYGELISEGCARTHFPFKAFSRSFISICNI